MNRVLPSFLKEIESIGWTVSSHVPNGQGYKDTELLEVAAGADAMIIGDDEASEKFFEGVGMRLGR
jgi:hypothetical protein